MDNPGITLDIARSEPVEAPPAGAQELEPLVAEARRQGASAIHLGPGVAPLVRVAGSLRPVTLLPAVAPERLAAAALRLMPERLAPRWRSEGRATFAWELAHRQRCRVTLTRQRGRPAATLRPLPTEPPSAQALGLPPAVAALARRPHGLVILAGAGVSGTSSTVAAIIHAINQDRTCRVVTIEDPVEILHDSLRSMVEQREVGTDTPGVAEGLAAAVAADADVIAFGDVADAESARLSVLAAQGGALVLATVDAPSARVALERFLDFLRQTHGDAPHVLARVLDAVTAQRLLPGAGEGTRPKGLVAAFEVLIATGQVRTAVEQGRLEQITQLLGMDREQGMQSMDAAMDALVRAGTISPLARVSG